MSTTVLASNCPEARITEVPPTKKYGRMPLRPPMWNSGRPDSHTSSAPVMLISTIMLAVFMNRLKWESIAPLGRPVVPDVYMMKARSCSATSMCGASDEAAAVTPSYGSAPGPASSAGAPVTKHVASAGTLCRTVRASPASPPSTSSALAPQSLTM